MKSVISLVAILIAIIHQLIVIGGAKKHSLRGNQPSQQYSAVEQDHNATTVPTQNSHPATVIAIQEEAPSHELPAQEQHQHQPPIDENFRDEILPILPKPGSSPEAAILQEEASQNEIPERRQDLLPIDKNSTITSDIVKHSLGHQPSPQYSAVKQDHDTTIVPKPTSNPTTVLAIQEHAPSDDLPTQEQQEHLLPIDENSTITSDTVKIWHDTDSREICVAFKQDARCPHPALLGRLSGPSLAILEWKERPSPSSSNIGTVMCGSYGHNWLDAGDYFVEIIIMYCNDFGVNALQRTGNITAWMEAGHGSQCVEDVRYNRITSKEGSIIHIPASIEGRDSYRLGRWIRKPHLPPEPLFSRTQPLVCAGTRFGAERVRMGTPLYQYCNPIVGRDRNEVSGLYRYEFQWNTKGSEEELAQKLRQRQRGNSIPRICAIGDSHSHYMVSKSLPNLNLTGLIVDYIPQSWPKPEGIVENIANYTCDVYFVQVAQWPSSWKAGTYPFSFRTYHDKVKQHVQNILDFSPKATVYLLTVDQAPLMAKIAVCKDWRAPTLMDGYSYMNQMIVQELNTSRVRYIDTNFIIYTHWDGHPDWQHLQEVVRSRKTIYTAAIMSGETEWFE